jgi:hypothetical protein
MLLIAALTLGSAYADPQQIIQIQPAPLPGMQPTVLIDNRPAPNVIVITPLATPAPMVVKPMEPIQPVRPMGTGFGQPPSQWDRRWP